MRNRLATAIALAMLAGCGTIEDKQALVGAVEMHGFTDVEPAGEKHFYIGMSGCDGSTGYGASRFIATAPNGKRVQGYLCKAWWDSDRGGDHSIVIEGVAE